MITIGSVLSHTSCECELRLFGKVVLRAGAIFAHQNEGNRDRTLIHGQSVHGTPVILLALLRSGAKRPNPATIARTAHRSGKLHQRQAANCCRLAKNGRMVTFMTSSRIQKLAPLLPGLSVASSAAGVFCAGVRFLRRIRRNCTAEPSL